MHIAEEVGYEKGTEVHPFVCRTDRAGRAVEVSNVRVVFPDPRGGVPSAPLPDIKALVLCAGYTRKIAKLNSAAGLAAFRLGNSPCQVWQSWPARRIVISLVCLPLVRPFATGRHFAHREAYQWIRGSRGFPVNQFPCRQGKPPEVAVDVMLFIRYDTER